jgi:drug/metabolite transporter (DMT)-like permease
MILAAAVLWGATATVARLAFRDYHVPALTVVELRLFIASALMLPWMMFRDRAAFRVERRDWGYFLVLGIFGVAAVQGTYYYSISRLGVGLSILLQYLAPALIVLWEMARGRPTRARTMIAILAAVAGTGLLVGGFDARAIGARFVDWAVGFGSAITFSFYIVYSKRGLTRYPPITVLFYTFLIAGIFWAVVTPPWKILAAGYGRPVWMLFLVIGIGSTLLPFTLFYAGLRRLRAEEAGILATLEPVVAVLIAAVFLGESLRSFQWLGAALVLAATLLVSLQAPQETAVATERL